MTGLPRDPLPEAESPDRFAQARSAQSVALMEDYVELIGDLIAEAGEARAEILPPV